MPTIDDKSHLKGIKKTFEKKEYRSWLLDDVAQEEKVNIKKMVSFVSLPVQITKETEDKTEAKLETNRGQTGDKQALTEAKLEPNRSQTRDKSETQSEPKPEPNWRQSKQEVSFITLSGLQREIAIFLYNASKLSRDKITDPVSIEHLALSCTTTKFAAKKAIQRMEQKGVVLRKFFKEGRAGWTRYEISRLLFQEIMHAENSGTLIKRSQIGAKLETELKTEVRPNALYSSSNLNYDNTTTDFIPEEFESIDITPLSTIGFTKQHLNQIIQKSGLTHEMIQDSIDAISFDMRRNSLGVKLGAKGINSLRFIMGILLKGPYNPPDNFESPAQEKMREYIERKKAMKERDDKLMEEAINLSFGEWSSQSENDEKIQNIIHNIDPMMKKIESYVDGEVFKYYKENIWPAEKDEILKGMHEGG